MLGLVIVHLFTNLKFLRSPSTKIRKATQNVEIGVVWGLGLPKVIDNITIR